MDRSAAQSFSSPQELLFQDGLGDRLLIRDSYGRPLHESLLLRADLVSAPSFELALNQRLAQLLTFDHPSFVSILKAVRVPGPFPRLSLISEYSGGVRLSDVLAALESGRKSLPIAATLFFIKEILDAIAELHRRKGEMSHGALAPERIVVVGGKVRIADYALGSAIEQLRFSSERYWKDLRVTVPASAGGSRLDRPVDVAQIGMIALALFAGRPLRATEHIAAIGHVVSSLTSLPSSVRAWLTRSLHMDHRRVFVNAAEASKALDEAMREADVWPSAIELGNLGVRTKRIAKTVPANPVATKTISTKAAPTPPAVSPSPSKPAASAAPVVISVQADPWQAPDVGLGTMFTGEAPEAGSAGSGNFLRRGPRSPLAKFGIYGAMIAATFTIAQYIPAPSALFSRSGTLVVESKPPGVELRVDGHPQGVTPITVKLKSGVHQVELRGPGKPRVFKVFISNGARVSQYIEFPSTRTRR